MTDYWLVNGETSEVALVTDVDPHDEDADSWEIVDDDLRPLTDEECRGQAIAMMADFYKRNGLRRGAARRLARAWFGDDDPRAGGKRKGRAAAVVTRELRNDRLDRRGRCWRKIGFFSGNVYCGQHGFDAGWPCAAIR